MIDTLTNIFGQFMLAGIPSLPELLLHELDMLQQGGNHVQEQENSRNLANSDLFLQARLLAHSQGEGANIDDIGREGLATIIRQSATTTCFTPLSPARRCFLKHLYVQAVLVQQTARLLAEKVLPESSEKLLFIQQAGTCGLFLNVGALVLEQVFSNAYLELLQETADTQALLTAENREFGVDHAQLGAALMQSWHVDSFCSDAVRYQHYPFEQILDATPLVKIAWLANQLADEKENKAAAVWAKSLYNLDRFAIADIRANARSALTGITGISNIAFSTTRYLPLPKQEEAQVLEREQAALISLRERVESENRFLIVGKALSEATAPAEINQALALAVSLLHAPCDALLFSLNKSANTLDCVAATNAGIRYSQLAIGCEAQRSVIADCYLNNTASFRIPASGLTVIDSQVLSLLAADNFCCEPLSDPDSGKVVGVLALGVPYHQSDRYKQQVHQRKALCNELGNLLSRRGHGTSTQIDLAGHYEMRIRNAIHEVNNPLGIIKNYLQLLSMKQNDDARMQSEINFIKSEIDRVANILEKLKDVPGKDRQKREVKLNTVIGGIVGLFRGGLSKEGNISIETRLDKSLPVITCNEDAVRQIITNLVMNATEALVNGGTITITTVGNIHMNEQRYIQLSIRDNGPGIAPEILDNLFAPGQSTKGKGHSGSGLAIVSNLIKSLNGQIVCQSRPRQNTNHEDKDSCGTEFTVFLPLKHDAGSSKGHSL